MLMHRKRGRLRLLQLAPRLPQALTLSDQGSQIPASHSRVHPHPQEEAAIHAHPAAQHSAAARVQATAPTQAPVGAAVVAVAAATCGFFMVNVSQCADLRHMHVLHLWQLCQMTLVYE